MAATTRDQQLWTTNGYRTLGRGIAAVALAITVAAGAAGGSLAAGSTENVLEGSGYEQEQSEADRWQAMLAGSGYERVPGGASAVVVTPGGAGGPYSGDALAGSGYEQTAVTLAGAPDSGITEASASFEDLLAGSGAGVVSRSVGLMDGAAGGGSGGDLNQVAAAALESAEAAEDLLYREILKDAHAI